MIVGAGGALALLAFGDHVAEIFEQRDRVDGDCLGEHFTVAEEADMNGGAVVAEKDFDMLRALSCHGRISGNSSWVRPSSSRPAAPFPTL